MTRSSMHLCASLASALLAPTLLTPALHAQNFRAVRVASGLNQPCGVAFAPGETHRMFVIERTGRIRYLINGVLATPPMLNLSSGLTSAGYDQGLLGLAFHPDFAQNGWFFVNYTNPSGHTVVARYTIPPSTPNTADANSAVIMLGPIVQPQADHNGGCMRFGLDGKLYIAMGDGGFDPNVGGPNSQDPTKILGKLLRLDVDLPAPHIPADNPFFGSATTRNEIWNLGLRHVWQFSFDRETGDLYMGDVGENKREELNIEYAGDGGRNYGWRCLEGTFCTGYSGCNCGDPRLTAPLHEYLHTTGCSITGGFVYRGCQIPGLSGEYFFGDFCTGKIWSTRYDRNNGSIGPVIERTAQVAPGGGLAIQAISAFGEDAAGELYVCDYQDGELYKFVNTDPIVDCNLNGAPDSCDIQGGVSPDRNFNSTPDECECAAAVVYCTAKVNSLGCTPQIASSGVASATAADGFVVSCTQALNQTSGMLFYGISGPTALPYKGGTLCVAQPLLRTRLRQSGGSPVGVQDCSGTFSIDMNAFASGVLGGSPNPVLRSFGSVLHCQWWGRDSGLPTGQAVQLSNGLEYTVCY